MCVSVCVCVCMCVCMRVRVCVHVLLICVCTHYKKPMFINRVCTSVHLYFCTLNICNAVDMLIGHYPFLYLPAEESTNDLGRHPNIAHIGKQTDANNPRNVSYKCHHALTSYSCTSISHEQERK